MSVRILHGDMREVLASLPAASFSACVTDPPYHLTTGKKGGTGLASLNVNSPAGRARISTGFMGKSWDGGDIAFQPETWAAVGRVMKPGAHLVAFAGTKGFHRMVCAIEDAGFEIRDTIMWLYGSGFPKSHDVSKAIDKAAGTVGAATNGASGKGTKSVNALGDGLNVGFQERPSYCPGSDAARQWQGWGTALKPAYEPIVLARWPMAGTVAGNVLAHGTGGLNIDACRVPGTPAHTRFDPAKHGHDGWRMDATGAECAANVNLAGRWPANVVLSFPADEYALRSDATAEEKRELYRWLSENA